MIGSCEAVLDACGATHVRAKTISGGVGADAEFEFFWL